MPHHSVPRLGSACPHSGIGPWARREGPSMAQCLRSAIVVNGAPKSTSTARRPYSRPVSWWDCVSPVGAGLLAKAVGLLASMLNVPQPSRASPLPQLDWVHPQEQVGYKAASRASFAPTGPAQTGPAQTGLMGVHPTRARPAIRPPRDGRRFWRPVNHDGRTQALRSGHPGMDAGIAALGHGWPFAAGPRSNAGVRACRA
ncbi:hypothetical protein SAMN04488697_111158 [Pseudomonas sp. 43mfcvi1.1]|nr:hypothetical protein ATJ40_111158 [Pseudomonas sp. 43mfcvi1.1]SSB98300.1 hypothetical protein SAMN04488697_111158 [Pseudomonas sp. 43mfcvi1.1]